MKAKKSPISILAVRQIMLGLSNHRCTIQTQSISYLVGCKPPTILRCESCWAWETFVLLMQFQFGLCAKPDLRISNHAAIQALSGSQVYKTRVLNTRYFEILINLIELVGLLISYCFDYVSNGIHAIFST